MKKILCLLLALLPLTCIAEEELTGISINKIQLGSSFTECLDLISREGVEFESYRMDHPFIEVDVNAFGTNSYAGGADLLFDGDDKLCEIKFSLDFNTVREAYDAVKAQLGNAEIVYLADYLDNDDGDGYLDSGFPAYIVWKNETMVCELEIYSSFYIDWSSSLLSGLEVNPDDTLNQYFNFSIYDPILFEEKSDMYE
jgi:hypothetical protein